MVTEHRDRRRRVVVTGLGIVAPNGRDLETFWSSICRGDSAGSPVTRFDTSKLPSTIAAEIKDWDFGDRKKSRRFDLSIQYALSAAGAALKDSNITWDNVDPERVGIVEACSVGGMESSMRGQTIYETRGYRAMSPFTMINAYCGGGSGEVALELGIKGHAVTYSSGSASGNDALGYAYRMVRDEEVDVMVAGGAEAPLLAPLYGAFCLMRVMTVHNDDPKGAMRPCDKSRDGFLLGEGSAFLVLEELSHALSRGAKIYAEICGHGRACEAYHSVAVHPEGVGMVRAIQKALRDAHIVPEQVEYINMHGTATGTNDLVETVAVKKSFGGHARRLALSSTKPITGHLLAAAGALEALICTLAIHRQMIPMTANLKDPEIDCDLDYVMGKSRAYPLQTVLNMNVGFGGKNSCLVFRRYQ